MKMDVKNNYNLLNIIFFIASCLLFISCLLLLRAFYHDDAYIILRYAKNFLSGKGLVWNVGEYVEGYTCFLWLLLISMLGYLKCDLVIASKVLGVVFAFLTLLLFPLLERKELAGGALLLSVNGCFALWAVGGLETVGFGFFVLLGAYLFYKKCTDSNTLFFVGVIFGLATMTRPEGILLVAITSIFCLFNNKTPFLNALGKSLAVIFGFLIIYAPYFAWRLTYYGHFFPCTFYVKGGTGILQLLFGSRYVFHFAVQYGFPLLATLLVNDKKAFFSRNAYLISILLCYVSYIILVGGDHMQGYRFFVPLLPVFYLLIQNAVNSIKLGKHHAFGIVCFVILMITTASISYRWTPRTPQETIKATSHSYQYRYCIGVPDNAAYFGKIIGLYIKERWPSDGIIALNTAGSTPYYSDKVAIDMLGLNDYTIALRDMPINLNSVILKEIGHIGKLLSAKGRDEVVKAISTRFFPWQLMPGHGKGHGEYILQRKPHYIIIGPAYGSDTGWFFSDDELLASPSFHEQYQLREVFIPVNDNYYRYYRAAQKGVILFKYYERRPVAD